MATWAGLRCRGMARQRPVHHEALGAYFVGLREKRDWKQKEASELAQRRGLLALTRQVLLRLERGQVKNPEPDVLKAAAKLYGVPYDELVRKFVALRFSVEVTTDPIRQSRDQESGSATGDPTHDTTAASLEELHHLRQLVARYETEAREVRTVFDALGKVTLALEEIRKAPTGTSTRRRRDRKAG